MPTNADEQENATPSTQPSSSDGASGSPGFLRRHRGKMLACLLTLVVLCVAGYFYATSALFFNHWVRPAVEERLGRAVQCDAYRFSPFGSIELGGVEIAGLPGEEAVAGYRTRAQAAGMQHIA